MGSNNRAQFLLNEVTVRTQYGAVCWRLAAGQMRLLLVTSRDSGRWVIPKGWPMPGMTPEAAAALEAYEEAGVRGIITPLCLGLYGYDKILDNGRNLPCMVAVYPLQVTRLLRRFPERKERIRKWFTPEKAARKVDEPDLARLLAAFQPQAAS